MASWEKQSSTSIWPTWQDNKMFTVLLGIFMVYGIIFTGAKIGTALYETRLVGFSDVIAPTITVSATGKATTVPDLATVDMTVAIDATTATQSQSDASAAMNTLLAAIKALGIGDADLTTSYFLTSEVYDYDVSPAVVKGYQSTQTLTVKIRDTNLTSSILDAGPKNGATTVAAVLFSIDDNTAALREARIKAIAKAKIEARDIAAAMHVKLGRIISYSESTGGSYPMYYGRAEGDLLKATDTVAPPIEVGTQETDLTVYITYSIF